MSIIESGRNRNFAVCALILAVTVWAGPALAQCVLTGDGSLEQCQTLFAGQTIESGTVCVSVDGANLKVTYTTTMGWELVETHVWVGSNLSDMPQTNKGSPKIGNFPYASGDISGATTYTTLIPLNVLGFFCPDDADAEFFVAAHAVVQLPDGSDDGFQEETAWACGDRFVERGAWGTFFTITLGCDCNNGGGGQASCETSFAYFVSFNREGERPTPQSECFLDIDENGIANGDGQGAFDRWGWSTCVVPEWSISQFDLWVGAEGCDFTNATLVGSVELIYMFMTNTEPPSGTLKAKFTVNEGYWLSETEIYFGTEILPRDSNGDFTVSPGDYTKQHLGLDANGAMPTMDTFDCDATFLGGAGICFIAHAVVCKLEPPNGTPSCE